MGREQKMLERLRGTGNSQAGKERDVVQENATQQGGRFASLFR